MQIWILPRYAGARCGVIFYYVVGIFCVKLMRKNHVCGPLDLILVVAINGVILPHRKITQCEPALKAGAKEHTTVLHF